MWKEAQILNLLRFGLLIDKRVDPASRRAHRWQRGSALWSSVEGEVGWDRMTLYKNLQLPIPRSDQLCRKRGRERSYPWASPAPSIKTAPACPSNPNPLQNRTTRLQPVLRAKPGSEQSLSPLKGVFCLQG